MSLARLASLFASAALLAGCGGSGKPVRHGEPPKSRVGSAAAAAIVIPAGSGHLAAMAPRDGLTLRDRPNGRVIAHLNPQTDYGSPTVVWAAARRGRWLGVVAASLKNSRIGWLNLAHDHPRLFRSPLELVADVSKRKLELRRGGRTIRTITVTVGSRATPTPTGRFAVTDKLIPRPGSGYGCCILALSGHQPKLRPGWAGGDRIAIHGSSTQLVGRAASAGCLRAQDRDLRALMKAVPLGTPVVIRA